MQQFVFQKFNNGLMHMYVDIREKICCNHSVFTDPPSKGWGLLLKKLLAVFWPPLLLFVCSIVAGLAVGVLKFKDWKTVQFVEYEALIMAGVGVLASFVNALKDMLRDSAAAARSDAEAAKTAAFRNDVLNRLTKMEKKPKLDALKVSEI